MGNQLGREHPRTVGGEFLGRYCKFSTSFHQVFELRMCAFSHQIREQANWWEKVKDRTVIERLRAEALRPGKEGHSAPSKKLTPAMVRFVIFEPILLSSFLYLGQLRTRGAPRIRIST